MTIFKLSAPAALPAGRITVTSHIGLTAVVLTAVSQATVYEEEFSLNEIARKIGLDK